MGMGGSVAVQRSIACRGMDRHYFDRPPVDKYPILSTVRRSLVLDNTLPSSPKATTSRICIPGHLSCTLSTPLLDE